MATKQELRDAFQRQGNAMARCCSDGAAPVAPECMGLRGRRAQIASRVSAWNALPAESSSFDAAIGALNGSAAQLEAAGNDQQCRAAITAGHGALDRLEQLLDGAGQ